MDRSLGLGLGFWEVHLPSLFVSCFCCCIFFLFRFANFEDIPLILLHHFSCDFFSCNPERAVD